MNCWLYLRVGAREFYDCDALFITVLWLVVGEFIFEAVKYWVLM
jgi:hypothetical protein